MLLQEHTFPDIAQEAMRPPQGQGRNVRAEAARPDDPCVKDVPAIHLPVRPRPQWKREAYGAEVPCANFPAQGNLLDQQGKRDVLRTEFN